MATYAISDIHGCLDEFQRLLDKLSPTEDDSVYILGDIADRGPRSADTIVWCVNEAPDNFHFLLGNHDLMMRNVLRRDPHKMPIHMGDTWAINGGYETAEDLFETTSGEWRQRRLLDFLDRLKPYEIVETDTGPFALVHAGFDQRAYAPDAASPDVWSEGRDFEVGHGFGIQNELVMCWVRRGWFDTDDMTPMPCVFGHTPTPYIARLAEERRRISEVLPDALLPRWAEAPMDPDRIWRCAGKVGIDCGCAYGGRLAALRLEDGEELYVDGPDLT